MYEITENINIKDMIYEVRGKQIMLDSDLAVLYGCANGTKTINLAVKRNIERFPKNFYFQLKKEEYDDIKLQNKSLRFQIETLKEEGTGKHRKYLLYAFTEQGIYMLATILKTKVMAEATIKIMGSYNKNNGYFC